jgi:hypothetical protein
MAIFAPGESRCPLCGEILYEDDDRVATTAFLFPDQPLSRYSDAVMHRGCFLRWEHRVAFVKAYNDTTVIMDHRMRADGTYYVPWYVRVTELLLNIFVWPFFYVALVLYDWWRRRRG